MGEKEKQDLHPAHGAAKISCLEYVIYYVVLFFAFWFGSHRFDVDGDGDFDPQDVRAYLADKNFLQKNRTRRARFMYKVKLKRTATNLGSKSPSGTDRSPSSVEEPNTHSTHSGAGQEVEFVDDDAWGVDDDEDGGAGGHAGQPEEGNSSARHSAQDDDCGLVFVEDGDDDDDDCGLIFVGDTWDQDEHAIVVAPVVVDDEEDEEEAEEQEVVSERVVKATSSSFWDRDGDGKVSMNDFVETKTDGQAEEDIIYDNLSRGQTRPVFILLECFVCLSFWVVFAALDTGADVGAMVQATAGLDSLAPGLTDLRLYGPECEDYRAQVWRWITYQFTHSGLTHVCMNVFLLLMLGIPIEGFNGPFRTGVMFNIGVLGGAVCNFISDGHGAVVGCSGGCYALIGIHCADVLINWSQKKFRIPTLTLLLLLAIIDVTSSLGAGASANTSHAAHVGGWATGWLIGVIIVKNMQWLFWEKLCFCLSMVLLLSYFTFGIAWLFMQASGPESIIDKISGEGPGCWHAQVYNRTFAEMGLGEHVRCVRCGTSECVEYWKTCIMVGPVDVQMCIDQLGGFYTGGHAM